MRTSHRPRVPPEPVLTTVEAQRFMRWLLSGTVKELRDRAFIGAHKIPGQHSWVPRFGLTKVHILLADSFESVVEVRRIRKNRIALFLGPRSSGETGDKLVKAYPSPRRFRALDHFQLREAAVLQVRGIILLGLISKAGGVTRRQPIDISPYWPSHSCEPALSSRIVSLCNCTGRIRNSVLLSASPRRTYTGSRSTCCRRPSAARRSSAADALTDPSDTEPLAATTPTSSWSRAASTSSAGM